MKNILLKSLLLFTSTAYIGFGGSSQLIAQDSLSTLSQDSLSEESWSEETYYEIGILRLQRWIKDNLEVLDDPSISNQIAPLIKEATEFANSGDFALANIWLETIWELLQTTDSGSSTQSFISENEDVVNIESQSNITWSKEILSGVDIWRHEISYSIPLQDSSLLKSSSENPYTGFRMNFDYESINRVSFRGQSFFKYSKDYLTGELDADFDWFVTPTTKWNLENRFEGSSYYSDFDLKYLQNLSTIGFTTTVNRIYFGVEDELLLRRYANSDSLYPNYYANNLRLNSRLNLGLGSWLELGYTNIFRVHAEYDLNDYMENRFELNWTQRLGELLDFSFDNELRFRDYQNVPEDYFFQDFWENYFWGDVELNITQFFGAGLTSALTKRDYKFVSESSLPDFLNWEVEPELFLKIGTKWKLGLGFHYGEEQYQNLEEEASRTAISITDVEPFLYSSQFEDYHEYGPMLTLDFLEINNLILSLKETFLFRRYPNSPNQNTREFNFYTDRNINSLLLFATWNITRKWQLNVLANMDDDRSRKDDSSDSQNTLLDFELRYSF